MKPMPTPTKREIDPGQVAGRLTQPVRPWRCPYCNAVQKNECECDEEFTPPARAVSSRLGISGPWDDMPH